MVSKEKDECNTGNGRSYDICSQTLQAVLSVTTPLKARKTHSTGFVVIHRERVPEGEGCPFTTPFLVFSSEFITSL